MLARLLAAGLELPQPAADGRGVDPELRRDLTQAVPVVAVRHQDPCLAARLQNGLQVGTERLAIFARRFARVLERV